MKTHFARLIVLDLKQLLTYIHRLTMTTMEALTELKVLRY